MEMSVFGPESLEAEAIAESRYNARVLLRSSEALFQQGIYGAAISLSILACEEVGKFLMFQCQLGADFEALKGAKLHRPKQEKMSSYLQTSLRMHAVDWYFCQVGVAKKEDRLLAAADFIARWERVLLGSSDDPEAAEILSAVNEKMATDPAYRVAEEAASGCLDPIKQRGFYVDIKNGKVQAPRAFGEQDAEVYCRAARVLVEMIAPEHLFGKAPVRLGHCRIVIGSGGAGLEADG